jgi:site-specific DNA recombinase
MRAAIYSRVSHEEQVEGWSLDAQHELCLALVRQRNWSIAPQHIHYEPGRSAKTDARPAFQRMMRQAQARQFDYIIVHKLDRFSRSLSDVVKNVALLKQSGVGLVSVSELWVDTTTPQGEFMLHLFALLAQWDNQNRARETAKGKAARARAGFWNGTLTFGYTTLKFLKRDLLAFGERFEKGELNQEAYIRHTRLIEDYMERWTHMTEGDAIPHLKNQYGVILAYEMYSIGNVSDHDIAVGLNEEGYRTTGNWGEKPFENDTVRPMLQNRFYLGETQYKGNWLPGRHEALISEDLFQKCQEVRARRRSRTPRQKSNRRVYPLSRLVLCAECEQPLRGQPNWQDRRYYRAPKRADRSCSGRMIPALEAEQAVLEYLAQIRLPADWRERVLAMSQAKRGDSESYETKKTRLENRLERLKTLYKLGDIEQGEYITERADIHNKLEALKPSQVPEMEDAAAALEQIGSLLKRARPEELEILFHSMLTTVYLHHDYPGYVMGIEPKPFLQELMDISVLPTWKPPQKTELAPIRDNDDPEPDGDGNGHGANRSESDGPLVPTRNHSIMIRVDAGEDHRVAVTVAMPVAPD